MSLASRFWAKVQKTDSCWLWTAADGGHGYGMMRLDKARGFRLTHATRIAWEVVHGVPPPSHLFVLHHCDNPRCVNAEAHLYLGTQKENLRDAKVRGRLQTGSRHYTNRDPTKRRKGAAHPRAKLTAEAVAQLRAETGQSQSRLAVKYGISQAQVSRILLGARWA